MLLLWLSGCIASQAVAETVGDLGRVSGDRANRVAGYGLVVGLPGTGDQTTEIPYTAQTIENLLRHMGITLPSTAFMQPNNVASVMVTATMPPDARPGQKFTVTVSAMGNASSLRGGVLVMTPLRGADGQVFAQAQGSVVVSGVSAQGLAASQIVNTPTVGRVPDGGVVEIPTPTIPDGGAVTLMLRHPGYVTAARMTEAINQVYPDAARAEGPGAINVVPPVGKGGVGFLSSLLQIPVSAPQPRPTVVVNAQDGTVVMGDNVRISPVAVATGSLSITVVNEPLVSQPAPFSRRGRTVITAVSKTSIKTHKAHLVYLNKVATMADVVRSLNAVGATPQQMISILEAMKAAGALHARLKVI